jgi:hypothetical protein
MTLITHGHPHISDPKSYLFKQITGKAHRRRTNQIKYKMGGDGGVIATKRAFSRGVGKNSGRDHKKEGRNAHEELATRARTCALTNEASLL